MSEREPPQRPEPPTPTEVSEPPPFEPQLDLIGDMERSQIWIVDHERQTARRADDA